MANVIQSAISSIRRKADEVFNDNQGWFRGGKFTPVQQTQQISNSMTDNTGLVRGNKFGVPQFTPIKALGDYSYKGGPTVREAFNKLPEQAQQDWGQAGLVRGNPLLQKFAPKTIEPLATAVELGPAAYMNTWSKAATTFSRDTTPVQQAWDVLGAYGSLNPAYATKNLISGPLGVVFGGVSNKWQNSKDKKLIDQGNIDPNLRTDRNFLDNWKQGWQGGQEFQFHANPINQATGNLVNQIAKNVPFLQKLTNEVIANNKINPTDSLKQAFGKWVTNSGKQLVKAATLETIVETPIWATMTKTEQETYLEAVQREAVQNLVMNVGMAGFNSMVDARNLAPIVKSSIDTAATNYWKNASSPESLEAQSGKINLGADVSVKPEAPKVDIGGVSIPQNKGNKYSFANTNYGIQKNNDGSFSVKEGRIGNSTKTLLEQKIPDDLNKEYQDLLNQRDALKGSGLSPEATNKRMDVQNKLKDLTDRIIRKLGLEDFGDLYDKNGKFIKGNVESEANKLAEQLYKAGKLTPELTKQFQENPKQFLLDNSQSQISPESISTPQNELINEAKKYKSAEEFVSNQVSKEKGFRDSQLAPNTNDYSIKDVFAGKSNQPKDILTPSGLTKYNNDNFYGKETIDAINNAQKTGKITIYRAVPKDVGNIENGDWIYLVKNQAIDHGLNRLNGDYKIISKEVPAKDIHWDGNDIREWGYDNGSGITTKTKPARMEELRTLWNKANEGNIQQPKNIEEQIATLKQEARFLENNSEWDKLSNVQAKIENLKSQISPESKGIKSNIQTDKVSAQDGILPPIKQTELPESNKVSQPQDILSLPEGERKQIIVKTKAQLKKVLAENPNANVRIELTPEKGKLTTYGNIPDRQDVAATLPNRLNNFVEDTLGYSTKAPVGGGRKASLWTRTLRKGQTAITTKVEEGLGSENPYIRNAATFVQNFFRGLGMSPERAKASSELRGEMTVANQRAYDVMDELYKSLGNNKKSLERINAVLDPEISTNKVTFDQLTKTEKEVYGLIREGLDLVHDTSYANGHISAELYAANKGKYVPRLYDVTELPPEVNKFVTQNKKINNDLYKQRKDVNAWKQENSLNDPVYALGKRLSQVQTNTAIKKYTDFLASNERFVSDVERPGFTKLSDSPAYGNLSGKYVLNSAAEDLKGFFFANQGMQNLYDAFRAYDRIPIRQLQKKLLTVFNPTTNVGNIVSDQVFGWVTGVDPFTLNKNLIELNSNKDEFKRLNDYLMKAGISGTDITRTDFTTRLGNIDELAKGRKVGKLRTAADTVQKFYGGTDEAYKVAALKSLLDKGFTLEEATRKVADGFQNYSNVGKFYDLAAKTPIIGKPFMKFQGDLIRIIKNGAVNNPLGLISFLGTLKAISYLFSKASGESDEDRETRENRFAAPMIPGLNIPLTWQTPIGEINVARYISPFYANNETTNMFSNMIPGVPNIDTKKDFASNVAMNVNDPLLSPIVQLGINRDFRGKPISDVNETKYTPSTLTPGEKLKNQALWTGRAYLPPPVNSVIDVGQVATTGKNMYGSPQTVPQSIARLAGIKISDMSAEQVQGIREKDAEYQQKSNEYIQQQIQSVKKQQLKGEITETQAINRISNLESKKKDVDLNLIKGADDEIPYINENGNMATVNLKKYDDISTLPSDNKYNSAIKESKQYSEAAKIMDNTSLTTEQQQTALDRLGIDKTSADYYRVANDSDNLKTMFVMDTINKVKTQGGGFSDVIQSLANQRTEINGKMIASNGVLDNLVDEGIISKAQATQLKKYKFENGQLVPKSKTGTKAKKVSVTLRKMSAPKLSSSRTKVKRISVPKKTYKKLKLRKLKV